LRITAEPLSPPARPLSPQERGHPAGTLRHLPVITQAHAHPHVPPCNMCLAPWGMADGEFIRKCKAGVLQYALVQTGCTIVTFATQYAHQFHDGEASPKHAYMYVTVAINVSQMVALYCLVHFYHTFAEELKPLHPLPKFLCVKLVVFFSFWQARQKAGREKKEGRDAMTERCRGDAAPGFTASPGS
jgi:hypothetical protein